MRLDRITRRDARGWVDDMTKSGRGAPTVVRVLVVLSSIFSMGVEDELISANPASRVRPPVVERAPMQVWEPADVLLFLKVAGEHRLGAIYEFVLHTAMRRGEVCGLRWSDVDFDKATVRIANTRVKVNAATVEKGTKTESSASEVELSNAALAALRVWKLRQDLERQEWGTGAWVDSGFVVTMEDGTPVDPSYLTKLFAKLVARTEKAKRQVTGDAEATLARLSLHGLRHTAASYAWDATGDLLAVSKMLRHANTRTTEVVYTHMRQGKVRETSSAIQVTLQKASGHTMDHTSPLAG